MSSPFELYGDRLTRKIVFLIVLFMIVITIRIAYKEGQKNTQEPATIYVFENQTP